MLICKTTFRSAHLSAPESIEEALINAHTFGHYIPFRTPKSRVVLIKTSNIDSGQQRACVDKFVCLARDIVAGPPWKMMLHVRRNAALQVFVLNAPIFYNLPARP